MHHFLKIIHEFSLLANQDSIDKICFFFKLLLILPIRKLATKVACVLSHTRSIKFENSYWFITSRSVRLHTLRHKKFQNWLCLKIKVPKSSCYH